MRPVIVKESGQPFYHHFSDHFCCERFADCAPPTIYATLLDLRSRIKRALHEAAGRYI